MKRVYVMILDGCTTDGGCPNLEDDFNMGLICGPLQVRVPYKGFLKDCPLKEVKDEQDRTSQESR